MNVAISDIQMEWTNEGNTCNSACISYRCPLPSALNCIQRAKEIRQSIQRVTSLSHFTWFSFEFCNLQWINKHQQIHSTKNNFSAIEIQWTEGGFVELECWQRAGGWVGEGDNLVRWQMSACQLCFEFSLPTTGRSFLSNRGRILHFILCQFPLSLRTNI